jgi:hypothetical protein
VRAVSASGAYPCELGCGGGSCDLAIEGGQTLALPSDFACEAYFRPRIACDGTTAAISCGAVVDWYDGGAWRRATLPPKALHAKGRRPPAFLDLQQPFAYLSFADGEFGGGVLRLDLHTGEFSDPGGGLYAAPVSDAREDRQGVLWIALSSVAEGQSGDVFRARGGVVEHVLALSEVAQRVGGTVRAGSIAWDDSGRLLVSIPRRGLLQVGPEGTRLIELSGGPPQGPMVYAGSQNVVFGTMSGELAIYDVLSGQLVHRIAVK